MGKETTIMTLDPRTKMVIVVCLSTLALIYNTPERLLQLLIATVLLLLLFRIDIPSVWVYLKRFLQLMLVVFIIQCIFTRGGEVLLSLGSTALVSSQGLLAGASLVLRIIVIISAALILTTFSSRDFILGLVQWKVPYELAFMVTIAMRFLPLFRDEFINVVTAVQLRGVELKQVSWGKRIELFRCLLFPVVFSALLKAQQLAVAMESRGFRAYPQRTYLRRLDFIWADYLVMLIFVSATMILIINW
jgi:energy-coupling factor transport system permease protein